LILLNVHLLSHKRSIIIIMYFNTFFLDLAKRSSAFTFFDPERSH